MHISITVLVAFLTGAAQAATPAGSHDQRSALSYQSAKSSQARKQGSTPTPTDQGKSDSDRKITQRIRKALMDDSTLSFAAKNVTIVTIRGRVTLRGQVDDARERDTVSGAARSVVGAAKVDNKLVIKK